MFTYAYNDYLCLAMPTMNTYMFTYAYKAYLYLPMLICNAYYILGIMYLLTYNSLVFTYGMLILRTPDT